MASISRRAIDTLGGSFGTASNANQRASAISLSSGRSSPPAYSAVNAIISECGKAHDWLAKYSRPADFDADFLAHFAADAILDCFAGLDESGERAEHRRRESGVRERAALRSRE